MLVSFHTFLSHVFSSSTIRYSSHISLQFAFVFVSVLVIVFVYVFVSVFVYVLVFVFVRAFVHTSSSSRYEWFPTFDDEIYVSHLLLMISRVLKLPAKISQFHLNGPVWSF